MLNFKKKLMKAIFKLSVFVVITSIAGCEKYEKTVSESTNEFSEVEAMVEIIEQTGIERERLAVKDEYFILDGDIKIPFDVVDDIKKYIETDSMVLKSYTYPNPYYAYLSRVKDIKIYINSSVSSNGWSDAVEEAIYEWNNISDFCAVNMSATTSSSDADIVISTIYEDSEVVAQAEVCVDGSIGSTIEINTYYNYYSNSYKKNVIAHELGHNIGFAHSNGVSSFTSPLLIDGTSNISNNTCVMYPTAHSWYGFHSDEVIGAYTLYPASLDVSISGPSKGTNQGTYTWEAIVSGGSEPYTYFWESSYDNSNWEEFSTEQSITSQLPNNYNLYLRLTVTDQLGLTGTDTHLTINNSFAK